MQKRVVRRRADAYRVQSRSLRQAVTNRADGADLESDLTVGDDHYLARRVGAQRAQCFGDGRDHLRAAACFEPVDPLARVSPLAVAGMDRLCMVTLVTGREGHDLESVVLAEAVDQAADDGLQVAERLAHHRAA